MLCDDGVAASLHYDQVGSLRVVVDIDGNVIKEVLYDPFGGVIDDTNLSLRIPIGFGGGLHDRDLGFVRFGWRDYDVNTGRWTAPDPIGDKGGDPDWYGYCLDDPVNRQDPFGLNSFSNLYDDISSSVEESLSWKTVYYWRASEGACDKCTSLDGTEQDDDDVESKRPHPHCKCVIETCEQGIESDDWSNVYARRPRLEVRAKVNGLTGAVAFAIWKKATSYVEKKSKG